MGLHYWLNFVSEPAAVMVAAAQHLQRGATDAGTCISIKQYNVKQIIAKQSPDTAAAFHRAVAQHFLFSSAAAVAALLASAAGVLYAIESTHH